MAKSKMTAGSKATQQGNVADETLTALRKALISFKGGRFEVDDAELDILFQPKKYFQYREEYRDLLVQIWSLPDDNALKAAALDFIESKIKEGEFSDMAVILSLLYQEITPRTADLLCNYAEQIGGEGIGLVVHMTMEGFRMETSRYDVVTRTTYPRSPEEMKLIARVADAYARFAK